MILITGQTIFIADKVFVFTPKCCADKWMIQELKLAQDKIYIIIEGIAAEYFFRGRALTSLVFQDLEADGKTALVLPHPSPLNIKWFREHPEFMEKRIIDVEKAVHKVLGIPQNQFKFL